MNPCQMVAGWWTRPLTTFECILIMVIVMLVFVTRYKRNWRPPARLTRFGDRE